jgi:hypothetical protein
MLTSRSRVINFRVRRTAHWLGVAVLTGAACGAFFGLVFGGLETLLLGNPPPIPSVVLYFAACGVVAGALLGAFGALIENEQLSDAETPETPQTDSVEADLEISQSTSPRIAQHRELESRLNGLSTTDRRQALRVAARTPSKN